MKINTFQKKKFFVPEINSINFLNNFRARKSSKNQITINFLMKINQIQKKINFSRLKTGKHLKKY